jgi:hypothetical protein
MVARFLAGYSYIKMLGQDKDLEDRVCLKLMYQLTHFIMGFLPTEALVIQGTKVTMDNFKFIVTTYWLLIVRRIIILIRMCMIFVFFCLYMQEVAEPTIGYTFIIATYGGITSFSLLPEKPEKPFEKEQTREALLPKSTKEKVSLSPNDSK